jgi:predicted transcriptional regulator
MRKRQGGGFRVDLPAVTVLGRRKVKARMELSLSESLEFQKIVGEVAGAYFNNNHVGPTEIGRVIQEIAVSLSAAATAGAATPTPDPQPTGADAPAKPTPAQVRRSITPDELISFEDGRAYKTLRRHLAVRGLTPEQYRDKWGLPRDYPMTAPTYSQARAAVARAIGLGNRTARAAEEAQTPAPAPVQAQEAPPPAAVVEPASTPIAPSAETSAEPVTRRAPPTRRAAAKPKPAAEASPPPQPTSPKRGGRKSARSTQG